MKTNGARVLNAARSIDIKVNTALVQQPTDPLALASSLGASTTLVQGQISQFLPPTPDPPAPDSPEMRLQGTDEKSAVAIAKQRIMALQTSDHFRLSQPVCCYRHQMGLERGPQALLSKEGRLHIPLPWSKRSLPTRVRSSLSIEETRDGFARIRVTATPALSGGSYELRVADKEGRSVTVSNVVVASPSSPATIPEVKTLQEELKKFATCSLKPSAPSIPTSVRALINPGKINGIHGGDTSRTRTAIDLFLTITLAGEAAAPAKWADREGDVKVKATAVTQRVDAVIKASCES